MPKYDIAVKLLGEDGNAFNLIGITRREIAKRVGPAEAKDFVETATQCKSYSELLAFIQETVDVC